MEIARPPVQVTEDPMLITSSRSIAPKLSSKLGGAVAACLLLLAVSSTPALAASSCEGQTFSRPFESLGDNNSYALVPGSQFDSVSEGWQLSGGAHIAEATRPDGSSGGVLEMPAGSRAVSPPVCVTLQYPSARVSIRSNGAGPAVVLAGVAYASTGNAAMVAGIHAQSEAWTVSNTFNVLALLGGRGEETREVRFVFAAVGGSGTSSQLYGLYVDPWNK
jgi:hypothetical protein